MRRCNPLPCLQQHHFIPVPAPLILLSCRTVPKELQHALSSIAIGVVVDAHQKAQRGEASVLERVVLPLLDRSVLDEVARLEPPPRGSSALVAAHVGLGEVGKVSWC